MRELLARIESKIRQLQNYSPVFDGDPEGNIDAPLGALGRRRDGTAGTIAVPGTLIYAKTTAAGTLTGWVAIL